MDLNFSVFQEPRGIMRLLHFVFSIIAFSTVTGYTGQQKFNCNGTQLNFEYDYPFDLDYNETFPCGQTYEIYGDFSGDAKFFVWTGILSLIFSTAIIVVYLKFDKLYKQNPRLPLVDFIVTVILGVFWLSSSAAWANGLTGLKYATDIETYTNPCGCAITSGSYFSLNISVVFGFLNFFLWASDLWFLYKETSWFQGNKFHTTSGP